MDEQPRCIHRCVKVTDNGICDWCTRKTEEALEAMAGLYDQVREKLLESQASIVGDRVSGTRERPLGLSVDALSFIGPANDPTSPMRADYRDQHGPPPMLDTLGSWTRLVVEELDSKALVVHTAEGLASFLLIHHDWARKQPWADDYAEEIRQCAHEAKRLCGLYDARPTALDMVMCKRCEAFALVKVPGSRWAAECTGEIRNDRGDADLCGKLYTEQEYTDWVKLNAAYAKSKGKTA